MEYFSFQKLNVYIESRKLVVEIYKIIRQLPGYEKYDLGSQIRRSVVSIPANIAEGNGRMSYKEKIHFLEISYASLFETFCHLELCRDLGYITEDHLNHLIPSFEYIAKMISSLRNSYTETLRLQEKYKDNTNKHPK